MRDKLYLDNGWKFWSDISPQALPRDVRGEQSEIVRIPHSVAVTPLHYFDESVYQMVSLYERELNYNPAWNDNRVFITFEGAAHEAYLYINDELVMIHSCGYTAFTREITKYLHDGTNLISVRLDSRESLNQPPFGNVIDYMTYGGIYRDVYLTIAPKENIEDVFVKPIRVSDSRYLLSVKTRTSGELYENSTEYYVRHEIIGADGTYVCASGKEQLSRRSMTFSVDNILEWDLDTPNLYTCVTSLYRNNSLVDQTRTEFGFRSAVFKKDGFYLNERKVILRGLNRHQSYPYVGYAMPKSMQQLDAHVLKDELGLNAVRTSHYPQSQDFIRECDRIGLLVFTEIPGWQHIGDKYWKHQAYENVRAMILQNRNHPSIILWGVRINESPDCDILYEKTNTLAHKLDPTRATGGVRCIKNSHLLEDVYTYNDFSFGGRGKGILPKRSVTPDMKKAYLISEYNGHMFPTKSFDNEYHRTEHAIRHAYVLNAIAGEDDIAGGFGWCMADYNTHQDFGSGDRICYHGVLDMFRNPKPAAAVYASQSDDKDIFEITSNMDIGEKPECVLGNIYAITNADLVRFYRNGELINEFLPDYASFPNLAHPPIKIDDFIGDRMRIAEGFTPEQDAALREILNAAAIYGMANIPKRTMARAAKLIVQYGMTMEDAYRLYGEYVGTWGCKGMEYRFEAVKDGAVVNTIVKSPSTHLELSAEVSSRTLTENYTYDVAEIRLTLRDQNGSIMSFANEPVIAECSGEIELIGPRVFTLHGGMGGVYVRSTGRSGAGSITFSGSQFTSVTIEMKTYCKEAVYEG